MQLEGQMMGRLVIAALAGALFVGCTDAKTVGLVSARDRAQPLTPGTRAELESRGATCTPNPSGPVLCSWSNGTTTCDLTFDQNDLLTRLACTVDGLTFTCTRPSSLYVCSWSDDEGCGDVYAEDGTFIGYLCGQDLEHRIHPGVDAGPAPDAGHNEERDAGVTDHDAGPAPTECAHLTEEQCLRVPDACRPHYCPTCDANNGRFTVCLGPNDPIPDCAPPMCQDECANLGQQDCEASSACHGVYVDNQNCGCAPAGCCTRFDHCAAGPADCDQSHAICDRVSPVCEGDYTVGIANGCYEGCVRHDKCTSTQPEVACTAQPPVFPRFENACQAETDCSFRIRQTDCCGTQLAVGLHPADGRLFEEYAQICASQYPACGCASRGILADDGHYATDPQHIGVGCVNGACITHVIP